MTSSPDLHTTKSFPKTEVADNKVMGIEPKVTPPDNSNLEPGAQ